MIAKILILLALACVAQVLLMWAVTQFAVVLLGGLGWWLWSWHLGRKGA